MRTYIIAFLLLSFSILAAGQTTVITGKVLQSDTKMPLSGATVFLSNSLSATSTSEEGFFKLKNIKPGQYSLVVKMIGYKEHNTKVLITNDTLLPLNIELIPQAILLKEVTVQNISKEKLKIYFEQFKEEFIGKGKEARDCTILNPEVLNFYFEKDSGILRVYTDDFLAVENKALGYRLKFLITEFKRNDIAGVITYTGKPLFEELSGSSAQKARWLKNRDEAYYGSSMHFYRALYRDSIQAEGFEIYHLTRQLNPEYEASPHKSSNTEGSIIVKEISLIPTYVNQKLANKPWKREEILRKTDISGLLGIVFPDYLYVVYTKRKEETYFKNIYRPPGVPAYETTVVTLPVKPHYLLIDKNGTIANDQSPMYEGTWSKSRIARLLPVDFVPTTKR